jgi:hypothetical protein
MSFIAPALVAIAMPGQRVHLAAMTKRATQRPEPFEKPAHWSDTPPPRPEAPKDEEALSPTRYGDWVKDGIAVDF